MSALKGARVLLVEDEAMIAMELEFNLADEGAEVVGPYGTLARALEAARDDEVEVALLDVDLGGKDVFPAADLLHARGVPIVFHTGHADRVDLQGRYEGASVCSKPTPWSDMVTALVRRLR